MPSTAKLLKFDGDVLNVQFHTQGSDPKNHPGSSFGVGPALQGVQSKYCVDKRRSQCRPPAKKIPGIHRNGGPGLGGPGYKKRGKNFITTQGLIYVLKDE